MEEGDVLLCEVSELDALREKVEQFQMEEGNTSLQQAVVSHPPLSLVLKQVMADEEQILHEDGEASVLIRITLPRAYPLLVDNLPSFELCYFSSSDRTVEVNADKQVASSSRLDEETLQRELCTQAQSFVPDPCIYETASVWLRDSVFRLVSS